jgi:ABC-type transport system substrate-binding protein
MMGLGGAALIGCGGGDEAEVAATSSGSSAATAAATQALVAQQAAATETGILTTRVDTSAQATRGGIFKGITQAEPEQVDPLQATSYKAAYYSRYAYQTLLEFEPGLNDQTAKGNVQGGLAESWEFADNTTLILNLRKDAKWDPRPPTNSRPFVAEDVVQSWKKFESTSNSAADLANSRSDDAPIIDMVAVDDHTVKISMAFSFGDILAAMAYSRWFMIQPQEAIAEKYNPRDEIRGTGPWMLDSWDRSVAMRWRANPNAWGSNKPFMDGFDNPVIDEYAQRQAQFKAGQLWWSQTRQEDIISTKEEIPELDVWQNPVEKGNWGIAFGLKPGSIWRDQRARQALSMLIDRELINDTFYDLTTFRDKGWPTKARIHGMGISSGYNDYWVDPAAKEFMDYGQQYTAAQSKLYYRNPEEAAKLMSAAGMEQGYELPMKWISTTEYGSTFPRVGEAYQGFFEQDGHFKIQAEHPDYKTDYLPHYYYGSGDFDGIIWAAKQGGAGGLPFVSQTMFADLYSQGTRQHVAYTPGGNQHKNEYKNPVEVDAIEGTSASDAAILAIRGETDQETQLAMIRQWQVDNVERMPCIPSGWPYAVAPYALSWPFTKNWGSPRDHLEYEEQQRFSKVWIDEPLRKQLLG